MLICFCNSKYGSLVEEMITESLHNIILVKH